MSPGETQSIRILLADAQEIFRAGLRAVLARFVGAKVVGEAGTAGDAAREIQLHQPDIVVLEVSLPEGAGWPSARKSAAKNWTRVSCFWPVTPTMEKLRMNRRSQVAVYFVRHQANRP